MNNKVYYCLCVAIGLHALFTLTGLHAFQIDKPSTKPAKISDISLDKKFKSIKSPFRKETIETNPLSLLGAAKDTLNHITKSEALLGKEILYPSFESIVSTAQTKETLRYIIDIIEEDKTSGNYRILDPKFIAQQFTTIRWKADHAPQAPGKAAPKKGLVRLTNYLVYEIEGAPQKTESFKYPLYQLFDPSLARKFTKQNILAGVLKKKAYQKKVKPLVWLTRDGLEEALMQGTVLVRLPDTSYKLFNVHIDNGIAYVPGTKREEQKRYWFFKQLPSSRASVKQFEKKMLSRKNVIFAGDTATLGVGKLLAIKHVNQVTKQEEIRLGFLADTGNAFLNNLNKLDFFAGIFKTQQALYDYIKQLPAYTQAYVLVKK